MASSVASRWAAIRVSVVSQGTGQPLNGALLRVTRDTAAGTELLGRGLSDERGEALVAISGIPVTTWGDDDTGQVMITEIDATLEAVFDPNAGAIVDPDSLEANRSNLPSAGVAILIASGRELKTALAVP